MSDKQSTLNNTTKKLIRIYSNDGEHINKIGQILTSQLSRTIYTLLINNELHAKEVAKIVCDDGELRLPNVVSILNKMVHVGLVLKQKKRQRKTGHPLSFYKAIPIILIVPSLYVEKITKSKSLTNTFHRIFLSFPE